MGGDWPESARQHPELWQEAGSMDGCGQGSFSDDKVFLLLWGPTCWELESLPVANTPNSHPVYSLCTWS